MCVTNTTGRRLQPVSFNQAQISLCPSSLTQHLLGGFAPSMGIPSSVVPQPQQPLEPQYVQVHEEKTRPKRRRKPQKPGKTAKNNDRHFVVHQYRDHSLDLESDVVHHEESSDDQEHPHRRRGGVGVAFPIKLHEVLDQVEADGLDHVISWQPHGRCFVIHKPKEFVDYVMPKYFRQTKLTSFQRQLNLYGFNRLTRGNDAGGYYHELFLRNRVFLCKQMIRTKVKGTRFKAASSPEQEPDFYSMPVVVSDHSDCDMSKGSSASPESYAVQQTFSYDPLPLQYASLQQTQEAPIQYYQPTAQVPYSIAATVNAAPPDADCVFDDAVDELFLNQAAETDTLDFCSDWDPSFDSGRFELTLNDDLQLGYMLEKLLED